MINKPVQWWAEVVLEFQSAFCACPAEGHHSLYSLFQDIRITQREMGDQYLSPWAYIRDKGWPTEWRFTLNSALFCFGLLSSCLFNNMRLTIIIITWILTWMIFMNQNDKYSNKDTVWAKYLNIYNYMCSFMESGSLKYYKVPMHNLIEVWTINLAFSQVFCS